LRDCGARSVLDLGCGPGELLLRLAREPQFERIVGVDISPDALQEARRLLQTMRRARAEPRRAGRSVVRGTG
jgi:methylase of polypeptide subunit release factors